MPGELDPQPGPVGSVDLEAGGPLRPRGRRGRVREVLRVLLRKRLSERVAPGEHLERLFGVHREVDRAAHEEQTEGKEEEAGGTHRAVSGREDP